MVQWAYSSCISLLQNSAKGRRIESRSFLFLLFVNMNVPSAPGAKKCEPRKMEQVVHLARRKAGAGKQRIEEERPAGVSGMVTRNGLVRFEKDN